MTRHTEPQKSLLCYLTKTAQPKVDSALSNLRDVQSPIIGSLIGGGIGLGIGLGSTDDTKKKRRRAATYGLLGALTGGTAGYLHGSRVSSTLADVYDLAERANKKGIANKALIDADYDRTSESMAYVRDHVDSIKKILQRNELEGSENLYDSWPNY